MTHGELSTKIIGFMVKRSNRNLQLAKDILLCIVDAKTEFPQINPDPDITTDWAQLATDRQVWFKKWFGDVNK
jgi:hypothetical protein